MNIFRFVALGCLIGLATAGCKKSKTADATPTYMNFAAGSTWTYSQSTNGTQGNTNTVYTLTSTSSDTVVSGKTYHVFSNSNGGSEYYAKVNTDYYTYQKVPAQLTTASYENLYLKQGAALNETWSQTFSFNYQGFPITVTQVNTILEKDGTKTVGSKSYTGVVKVGTVLSLPALPGVSLTTNITSFYAPGYGLIYNSSDIALVAPGNNVTSNSITQLQSAVLR